MVVVADRRGSLPVVICIQINDGLSSSVLLLVFRLRMQCYMSHLFLKMMQISVS
jgi:hypothetical protein